jgi:hypothetical protein
MNQEEEEAVNEVIANIVDKTLLESIIKKYI